MSFIVHWALSISDWRMLSAFTIIFLYLIERMDDRLYRRIYNGVPFRFFLVSLVGLVILYARLVFGSNLPPPLPMSPIVRLILFIIYTHLRSFIFYSVMIYYLWFKWDSLIPALYAGWFGIGFIEMSYIPQHWFAFGTFMGLQWYLSFFIIMMPLIFDRDKYRFNWKVWAFFGLGVFFQYFHLIWNREAFTTVINGVEMTNEAYVMNPTLGTWLEAFFCHLTKSLMTIAFCFVGLRK